MSRLLSIKVLVGVVLKKKLFPVHASKILGALVV
jgi:hypothetical protein